MQHHPNTSGGHSPREAPRKRVARACDRCRLKKGKCDGKEQCAKCLSADIMCIYTDRKPPQHKQISSGVAEALQSENLTLKKSCVILFKQLLLARQNSLPALEGVDWNSEKVASGKSGRALNYIISQGAQVDNRISTEEITNYESDTASHHDDGPASQHPSPRSTTTSVDDHSAFWLSPPPGAPEYEATTTSTPFSNTHARKRQYDPAGASKYSFPTTGLQDSRNRRHIRTSSNPNTFYNELQAQHNFNAAGGPPMTPPTSAAIEPAEFMPPMQWSNQEDAAFYHNVDPYTGATRDAAMTSTTEAWDMNPQFYNVNYIPTSSAGMDNTRFVGCQNVVYA